MWSTGFLQNNTQYTPLVITREAIAFYTVIITLNNSLFKSKFAPQQTKKKGKWKFTCYGGAIFMSMDISTIVLLLTGLYFGLLFSTTENNKF